MQFTATAERSVAAQRKTQKQARPPFDCVAGRNGPRDLQRSESQWAQSDRARRHKEASPRNISERVQRLCSVVRTSFTSRQLAADEVYASRCQLAVRTNSGNAARRPSARWHQASLRAQARYQPALCDRMGKIRAVLLLVNAATRLELRRCR